MIRNIIAQLPLNTARTIRLQSHIRYITQTASGNNQPTDAAEYELQQQHIEEVVRIQPTLAAVSSQVWQKAHQTFANHGLNTTNFLQIIAGNPKVLLRSPQKIIETLEYWRSCQFGEYNLFLLITKYPSLMDVQDQRLLLKQISYIQNHVGTSKNVWKLLMICPNIIEQTMENFEAKVQYLKDVMRIDIPEIVKSEALSKPLDDIKYRHVFLERLGLFKRRSLKADANDPTTNPRLYKITDTSEKTFATKICHVSVAEYEAFKELYSRELERQQIEEEYDEDHEYDEDEEFEYISSGKSKYDKIKRQNKGIKK